MKQTQRIAFIGNHLPRRCGIATFTHDLHRAVAIAQPSGETAVVAMTDPGRSYDYPPAVQFQIRDEIVADYAAAANFLNNSAFEVVSLQHEYGIFGGPDGRDIDELLWRIDLPIVTTLHTVLAAPTATQRVVIEKIIAQSSKVIVMAEKGRELLQSVHHVAPSLIEVIPHGIPDFPFVEPSQAKDKLNFSGKTVILTFGLLSPNKGIESVIDAMPGIIRSCPNVVYVVLGATHPNLVRQQGEAYREHLLERVRALGIENHVAFVNQFVDQATLLDFISMCDVYVTPYLHEDQMTSGTLAYSFGLGKAVVSTPYWHAKELLADGRGVIVPFGDTDAIGAAVTALLTNEVRRHAIRKRAYGASRSMTWSHTAQRYLAVFDSARVTGRRQSVGRSAVAIEATSQAALPEIRLDHLLSLCDDTGLLQHAVQRVANREHGYCVDDNARALLLACALNEHDDPILPEALASRFAAFVQHAWNGATGRFRNFMSYDRRWLEDAGSEDSHGRSLWALAACAARDRSPARRDWAAALFHKALPAVAQFHSPRAWAFTLLAVAEFRTAKPADAISGEMRDLLADRLLRMLRATQRSDWYWYEESLAYDNARLPQALIVTATATQNAAMLGEALLSLSWLTRIQTTPSGLFRPVGTDNYGQMHQASRAFDQQPLEATATIAASLAAYLATSDALWVDEARRAFAWFMGKNDLGIPLIDLTSGSCLDGLHTDRANDNCGAESVLSYLLALADSRAFAARRSTPPLLEPRTSGAKSALRVVNDPCS